MKRTIRIAAILLAGGAAFGGAARAAIVPFDINPDVAVVPAGVIAGGTLVGSPFTYYNIQYDIDGVGGADLNIRTARAADAGGPGVDQVVVDGVNNADVVTKGANSYLNTPFAAGDVIGDGTGEFLRGDNVFNVVNDGGFQMYVAGTNYLGFQLGNGNYGYVRVNYNPTGSVYTFLNGAYENSGTSIAAAVPEATSLTLAGIAAAGGLQVARRRGRRAAA